MGLNMNLDGIEKRCIAHLRDDLCLEEEVTSNLIAISQLARTDIDILLKDYILEGMKEDIDNSGIAKRRDDLRRKRSEYLKQKASNGSE